VKRAREIIRTAYALTVGDAAYEKRATWRGRPVRFSNRGPAALMGRFGGGWNRELGIQLGSRGLAGTIIVNLWKGSVRIDPKGAQS
jgi:hypothetical protein